MSMISMIPQSFKDFVEGSEAPIQIALFSIPGVNLATRYILNNVTTPRLPESEMFNFALEKCEFRKNLTTAVLGQLAIAVSCVALAILFPTALATGLLSYSNILVASLGLALSNILYDNITIALNSSSSKVIVL